MNGNGCIGKCLCRIYCFLNCFVIAAAILCDSYFEWILSENSTCKKNQ